jgi:hypothetical protein
MIASQRCSTRLARSRPKFRRWISAALATEFVDGLAQDALLADDPPALPGVSPDRGDDYLVALARAAGADCPVSGDSPRQFLEMLDA